MGTSLNGLTPSATYSGLIKFGDNSAITASLKALSDGNGNDTILSISTSALQIGGSTGLYWNDTNKRLGIGTNAPGSQLDIVGEAFLRGGMAIDNIRPYGGTQVKINGITSWFNVGSTGFGLSAPTARVHIQGSGSTSATTSLLVQNSSGNAALQIRDDRVIIMAGLPTSSSGLPTGALWNNLGVLSVA